MALTFEKLKEIDGAASDLDADLLDGLHAAAFAPVLTDVKTAAVTAESGWDIGGLFVAKSGNWLFISGQASKTDAVKTGAWTKFLTMSEGYRPGVGSQQIAGIGTSYTRLSGGAVWFDTNGDVEAGNYSGTDEDWVTFSVIYSIAT